ncbi:MULTISPECIES: ABC transporter ATP-binding protein [unclassified Clostridium]|uniref:ABC transporter ATP-binding protein n=1 Tax=unclassified Clostridium TaxID=2614128 RepID=UPI000297603C|nr:MULTISPECIES: ABC transporter ATP-binding protein [unclassified Clostridium]EKQ58052.1 MAG: ATPase component of ABC-type sugar transporter [Clostridium sp. Maddingley MBC34-26]
MSFIELKNINKFFDNNHVLKNVNLTIDNGDFMTFLGPSGCGKTTTLRVIAGLEKPEKGSIFFNGTEIDNGEKNYHLDPSKRDLSLVFQSYALWPHMTVYENIAFGLEMKKISKGEIKNLAIKALEKMQIANLSERYPAELSGGQQQRVAIARAMVTKPKILLMDEPLSNLDAKLRIEMRNELKKLHQESNTTIIYVTHDQHEALTLSTKVAVFFKGEIVQVEKPRNLYKKPATLEVAEFIGNSSLNILEGRYENYGDYGAIKSSLKLFNILPIDISHKEVILTIKPEDIKIHEESVKDSVRATVAATFPAGPETLVQLKVGNQLLTALVIGEEEFEVNSIMWVTYDDNKVNIYDKKSGKLIEYIEKVQVS